MLKYICTKINKCRRKCVYLRAFILSQFESTLAYRCQMASKCTQVKLVLMEYWCQPTEGATHHWLFNLSLVLPFWLPQWSENSISFCTNSCRVITVRIDTSNIDTVGVCWKRTSILCLLCQADDLKGIMSRWNIAAPLCPWLIINQWSLLQLRGL